MVSPSILCVQGPVLPISYTPRCLSAPLSVLQLRIKPTAATLKKKQGGGEKKGEMKGESERAVQTLEMGSGSLEWEIQSPGYTRHGL